MSNELRDRLNRTVPLPVLGKLIGDDWSRTRSIYCPFHDNTNTMAAKVYVETNTIYCFAEHRVYRPLDVMYQLLGWSTSEIVKFASQFDMSFKKQMNIAPNSFQSSGMTTQEVLVECQRRFDEIRD